MTIDVDQRTVELAQHDRNGVQRRIELRHDRVLIGVEGDVRRHVQDDAIADAGDRDTGPLQLGAQFGFLLVHIVADRATGERAKACADKGRIAPSDRRTADG